MSAPGRPVQVIAHRGSSGEQAEHTLAAFERALEQGADAVECDIRLTRDGVLVCVHDRKVNRTSDGRGVVSTLELAELAELDFASWKRKQSDPLLVDHDKCQLHIETKHPTRYGGLVEQRLVELLDRYGVAQPLSRSVSRVAVLSYASTSLRRIWTMATSLPTVLNMGRVPVRYRDGRLPPRVTAAGLDLRIVQLHPRIVEKMQSHGFRVHVFTADEPADIDYLLELGVDGVISNHPRRVLRRLGRS